MAKTQNNQKHEDIISMFLGLIIVLTAGGLIFNYFQKKRAGTINLPGISDTKQAQTATPSPINLTEVKKPTDSLASPKEYSEYIVKKNDNLWKIAKATMDNGYAWPQIAKANNLTNPRSISVGQKLAIPTINPSIHLPDDKVAITPDGKGEEVTAEYTVKRGDNLWDIAQRFYQDPYKWNIIWQQNQQIVNPRIISVGQKIIIPKL